MGKESELEQVLDKLDVRVRALSSTRAIELIGHEIDCAIRLDHVPHLEVRRAQILCGAGRLDEAVELLGRAAAQHPGVDGIHFHAAQCLVQMGRYDPAVLELTHCLSICLLSGRHGHLTQTYLLRAYCAARAGRVRPAQLDLEHVPDGAAMPWLGADPPVSKAAVDAMCTAT